MDLTKYILIIKNIGNKGFGIYNLPFTLVHFQTGDIFIGEFNTKIRRSGKGVNFNPDGTIYVGEWTEDIKHGAGTLYPNSNSYNKDENEIRKQIKRYFNKLKSERGNTPFEVESDEKDSFDDEDSEDPRLKYTFDPLKDGIEKAWKIQSDRESEMQINQQDTYKEEQEWEHGKLVKSTKKEF